MSRITEEKLRYLLTLGSILAILFIIALAGYLTGRWDQAEGQPTKIECVPGDIREQIRTLALQSLDEAFKDRIMHVFEVWMRDETGQPKRARVGVQQAINAYIVSRDLVLQWNFPICKG